MGKSGQAEPKGLTADSEKGCQTNGVRPVVLQVGSQPRQRARRDKVRIATRLTTFLVLCITLAACAPVTGAGIGSSRPPIRPLRLFINQLALPKLRVPRYATQGTYPQVFLRGKSYRATNRAIRLAILAEEATFTPGALASVRASDSSGRGLFYFAPNGRSVLATTAAVSMLIPTEECYPNATAECAGWFAATFKALTVHRVHLWELFGPTERRTGLRSLAHAVRRRLAASDTCVRDSLHDSVVGSDFSKGLRPRWTNFRNFALRPRGIAVGLDQDQVGYPYCGTPLAFVPYTSIRPYLSALGRSLTLGVR